MIVPLLLPEVRVRKKITDRETGEFLRSLIDGA